MKFSNIKHISIALLCTAILSACSIQVSPARTHPQIIQPSIPVSTFQLAHSHWTDVAKIRNEAQRLGTQVAADKITKVQAAQYLNKYRLELVGHNPIDDSVYEIYLRSVVDSQRGAIDSEQSKAYVESALRGWGQRWSSMSTRPNNPAFTNFLMEHMGLPPLK